MVRLLSCTNTASTWKLRSCKYIMLSSVMHKIFSIIMDYALLKKTLWNTNLVLHFWFLKFLGIVLFPHALHFIFSHLQKSKIPNRLVAPFPFSTVCSYSEPWNRKTRFSWEWISWVSVLQRCDTRHQRAKHAGTARLLNIPRALSVEVWPSSTRDTRAYEIPR